MPRSPTFAGLGIPVFGVCYRTSGDRPHVRRDGRACAGTDARQDVTRRAPGARGVRRTAVAADSDPLSQPGHRAQVRTGQLEVTAHTADGIVMGVRHRSLPIEGVQFHPESILTASGHDLLRNWLEASRCRSAPRTDRQGPGGAVGAIVVGGGSVVEVVVVGGRVVVVVVVVVVGATARPTFDFTTEPGSTGTPADGVCAITSPSFTSPDGRFWYDTSGLRPSAVMLLLASASDSPTTGRTVTFCGPDETVSVTATAWREFAARLRLLADDRAGRDLWIRLLHEGDDEVPRVVLEERLRDLCVLQGHRRHRHGLRSAGHHDVHGRAGRDDRRRCRVGADDGVLGEVRRLARDCAHDETLLGEDPLRFLEILPDEGPGPAAVPSTVDSRSARSSPTRRACRVEDSSRTPGSRARRGSPAGRLPAPGRAR